MDRLKPTILAVDDEADRLSTTEHELRKRYGADYDVLAYPSADAALAALRRLRDDDRRVALVLADLWLPGIGGIEVLDRVQALHPAAKRLVLVPWGDWTTVDPVFQAMATGRADYWIVKPRHAPDEQFHRVISEFLEEWNSAYRLKFEAVQVIADRWSPRAHELRDLLTRNALPYGSYDAEGEEGRALLEQLGLESPALPVIVLFNQQVLQDPSNAEIADAFGVSVRPDERELFDLVVIGAGPAGLGAAVYASSEGLKTLVVEREAVGGQAGSSSLIRNYLGFPRGVSGSELAMRAFEQAWSFGATFYFMRAAAQLGREEATVVVGLSDGSAARSRAAMVSTGVTYRRLNVPSLEAFVGRGVFYGAAVAEARAVRGEDVFVAGGGNSAGQAAVHLAQHAARVVVLVRGDTLAASMSEYLIRQMEAAANIEVWTNSEVVGGSGELRLEHLVVRDAKTGDVRGVRAGGLFVLIGSHPHTEWLASSVERDDWGFILTGEDLLRTDPERRGWLLDRPPLLFETSLPGVFAAGDVRHGSVKRVASSVGEGAIAVRSVHEYLRLSQ